MHPLLQVKMSIKNKARMVNSVDTDETISSGSTLFAKIFVLVYRAGKVKEAFLL